jgi:hypothetical protein
MAGTAQCREVDPIFKIAANAVLVLGFRTTGVTAADSYNHIYECMYDRRYACRRCQRVFVDRVQNGRNRLMRIKLSAL